MSKQGHHLEAHPGRHHLPRTRDARDPDLPLALRRLARRCSKGAAGPTALNSPSNPRAGGPVGRETLTGVHSRRPSSLDCESTLPRLALKRISSRSPTRSALGRLEADRSPPAAASTRPSSFAPRISGQQTGPRRKTSSSILATASPAQRLLERCLALLVRLRLRQYLQDRRRKPCRLFSPTSDQ